MGLLEQLNADAGKLNIWVRTELNAPAQRAWFTDTGGHTGVGQLAAGGRVSGNQLKALPTRWRWKDYLLQSRRSCLIWLAPVADAIRRQPIDCPGCASATIRRTFLRKLIV